VLSTSHRPIWQAVAVAALTVVSINALAAPLDDVQTLSGSGCRFPDVAYGSAQDAYLVVWADYTAGNRGIFGRRVDNRGRALGEIVRISESRHTHALFPAVAYNAARDEFLVTFDADPSIAGQRVKATDGTLIGGNFPIGEARGGIRSAVAWSATSNNYLVVYFAPSGGRTEIFGRRISAAGKPLDPELNLSQDPNFSGYPAIAYAQEGDQFLVTWDHEPSENRGHIRGQRISAASGKPLGGPLDIATGGTENRSTIAYDHHHKRWLVEYNESPAKGNSYDQAARFVTTQGELQEHVPIARTKDFEGDTQFGGDIAFLPAFGGRYFSSFASEGATAGMTGQELTAAGAPTGPAVDLGRGEYTSLNNAADTRHHRFLTVWEGRRGNVHFIHARLFAAEAAR
jgi:hypothetical protein